MCCVQTLGVGRKVENKEITFFHRLEMILNRQPVFSPLLLLGTT